jgi:hypothetical protein
MKILLLVLFFSSAGYAYVPMLFDDSGVLIEPDRILLKRGLEEYHKGQIEYSLISLERSAKFGNAAAKYLIALIHLEGSNAIKARAWLMLIKKPIYQTERVLVQLNNTLSKGEIELSNSEHLELKKHYNKDISYKTRKAWKNRIRTTGTHIAGLSGISTKNVAIISGGEMSDIGGPGNSFGSTSTTQATSFKASSQVRKFVREYEPKGIVILGEIKPKL